MQVILERWQDALAKNRYLALDGVTFQIASLSPNHPAGEPVSGWFAFYESRPFCVFAKEIASDGKFMLTCNDKQISLDSGVKTEWQSTIAGRTFKVFKDGEQIVSFRYRSPSQYLMHPVKLLRDIFLADDWWGLHSDLPSFVHSNISRPGGLVSALKDWNSSVVS